MKKYFLLVVLALISIMDVAAQKEETVISSSQLCNTSWKWVSPDDPEVSITLSFTAENLKETGKGKGIALTLTKIMNTGKDSKQKTRSYNYRLFKRAPNAFGKVQTVKENDKLAATGPESEGKILAYSEWGRIISSTYMTFYYDEIKALTDDSLTLYHEGPGGLGEVDGATTFVRVK